MSYSVNAMAAEICDPRQLCFSLQMKCWSEFAFERRLLLLFSFYLFAKIYHFGVQQKALFYRSLSSSKRIKCTIFRKGIWEIFIQTKELNSFNSKTNFKSIWFCEFLCFVLLCLIYTSKKKYLKSKHKFTINIIPGKML